MAKERIFYIAYRICTYLNYREQKSFEVHEFCMYVSELAEEIEHALNTGDCSGLEQYYQTLKDEIENLCNNKDWILEVKELIELLDECKK